MSNNKYTSETELIEKSSPLENAKAIKSLTSFKSRKEMLEHITLLYESGMLGRGIESPEMGFAVAQTGMELGLPMMVALNSIALVFGRPVLSWKIQTGLVQSQGVIIDVIKEYETVLNAAGVDKGNKRTVVEVTRAYKLAGGQYHVKVHRVEKDLKACFLAKVKEGPNKDMWLKYPSNMLRKTVITEALALYCADMLNGIYSLEEMADAQGIKYTEDANGVGTFVDDNGEEVSSIG